jgi:hypothetical protein
VRLERLRKEETPGGVRVAADVVWEDAPLPAQPLQFETSQRFAGDLEARPDAFAIAALPAAVWRGERRLRVEGRLCPRLRDGLDSAMAIWSRWYSHCRPLSIEATEGFEMRAARPQPRTSVFLSAGVDALALLHRNRVEVAHDRPDSIQCGITLFGVNGYDYVNGQADPARLAAFAALLDRLAPLAAREALELVPVKFDARWLLPDYAAWTAIGYGPMIASVAHVLGSRHTRVWLASRGMGLAAAPHGSHPDVDPLFSSAAVEIRVGDAYETRMEKLRRLADWEPARAILQPCHQVRLPRDGRINCGRCEKCVRTMLGLLALDRLREFTAFVEGDVRPRWIRHIPLSGPYKLELLEQCTEPLARAGRRDLVRAIRARRRAFEKEQRVSAKRA